jgi:hypothetical protein
MGVGVDQILVVLSVMSSFCNTDESVFTFVPYATWTDGGVPPTYKCGCSPLSWDRCERCSSGVHPSRKKDGADPIERDITSNLAEPLENPAEWPLDNPAKRPLDNVAEPLDNVAKPLQEIRRSGRTVNPPGWLDRYNVY